MIRSHYAIVYLLITSPRTLKSLTRIFCFSTSLDNWKEEFLWCALVDFSDMAVQTLFYA